MKFLFCIVLLVLPKIFFAQDADVLKSNAIMHEGQMEYLKAAELYEKAGIAYEINQQVNAFLWFKSGQNYNRVRLYDKALPHLLKAKENNYNEVSLFLSLADCYIGLKNFSDAERILLEGNSLYENNNLDFAKRLGLVYLNSKQYDKSVKLLVASNESYPNNYRLSYLLASTYERQKDIDNASMIYKKMLEIKPNDKISTKKLGILYFQQCDKKYKNEAKRYESLNNPSRVDYHNSTKKLEQISQEYKVALPYLEQAHANSPGDKVIVNCLSIAYRRLKMDEKADKFSQLK